MRWLHQRLHKSPRNHTCGIGPLKYQDDLGQSAVGAWVLASDIQIICKLLSDVRLLEMQGETIIVTLPTKCQPYLTELPSVKFQ